MFNWTEKSQEMMENWLDAQKTMWDGWTQAVTQNNPYADTMYKQWQETVKQGMNGKTFNGNGTTAQKTAEQFFSAQQTMLDFWQQSAQMWAKMWQDAPGKEQTADWQKAFNDYANWMKQQWQAPAMPQDWNQLWQQYQQQWQAMSQPWLRTWENSPFDFVQKAAQGEAGNWQNLYWDTYKQTVGKWLESPSLGLTREFNHKVEEGFNAWVELMQTQHAYQEVLAKVWQQAFQRFMTKAGSMAQEGQTVTSMRDWLLMWTQVGDEVFGEAFRTDAYIQAQSNFLNANMRYRNKNRAIMEVLLQTADLPTRSELDDAHKRIYELRKEVKSLKKAIAELQGDADKGKKKSKK